MGDLLEPRLQQISHQSVAFSGGISLIPGDLSLAGFEETLAPNGPTRWAAAICTPFSHPDGVLYDNAARGAQVDAAIILADIGPNLGAINRSALIAADYVIVPLGADLFSLQGLRNLGPTLHRWRQDWQRRRDNWPEPEFALPEGGMQPIGYVVQQHSIRFWSVGKGE